MWVRTAPPGGAVTAAGQTEIKASISGQIGQRLVQRRLKIIVEEEVRQL